MGSRITLQLPKETRQKLREVAHRLGIKEIDVIRLAVSTQLAKLEKGQLEISG